MDLNMVDTVHLQRLINAVDILVELEAQFTEDTSLGLQSVPYWKMPSFRRRRTATLQSAKIEQTWSLLAADRSTGTNVAQIICVKNPTADNEVSIGTIIKWIYVEFNVAAQTTTNPKVFHWTLHKNPTNALSFTPSAYNENSRSWIMKRGMEMLPADVATVFKRIFVVSVPKKMKRMSEGDTFQLRSIASLAETINYCGFLIYNTEPA